MPKRSSREDPIESAIRAIRQSTGEDSFPAQASEPTPQEVSAAAAALGRLGGKKGGPARAKALSAARRKAISRKAATMRWAKNR